MVEGAQEMNVDTYLHAIRNLRVTAGFTKKEQAEMKDVFRKFDPEDAGCVQCEVLGKLLNYMGMFPSDEMLEKLIKQVDADGGGEIDEMEFFNACRIFATMQPESWKKTFKEYDSDGTGTMLS